MTSQLEGEVVVAAAAVVVITLIDLHAGSIESKMATAAAAMR